MSKVQNNLYMILDVLGLKPNKDGLTVVANDLSKIANRSKPWSFQYVNSVLRGYKGFTSPSTEFTKAVTALGMAMDGNPIPGAEPVTVFSHDLREGIYIPHTAKVVKCKRPGCPVWFVKSSPRHEYHCPGCRPGSHRNGKDKHD